MTASIQMDRLFDGLVYAKEQPKTCLTEVNNSSEFELVMPLDGTFCNTVNNGKGLYSNYIMVQYNKKIVTSKDIGLSISCEYDLGSRNVTGTMTTNGYTFIFLHPCVTASTILIKPSLHFITEPRPLPRTSTTKSLRLLSK